MKKRFINDFRSFLFFVLVMLFFISLLIIESITTDYQITGVKDFFIYYGVFGGFTLLSCVGLFMSLEIITVSEDKITSQKLWKRTQIYYSEIQSIETTDKRGIGAGGIEPVWKIMSSDKTIYLIRTKRREKIIELIKGS